ncbi:MAG: hypothetical protein JRE63_10865 [Deltaproteobacteria bacterium]|jgi:DNA-binding beta-propeller fold protein YncE|nr:hypothetical protein [Deltaproteobacteria bacterium]
MPGAKVVSSGKIVLVLAAALMIVLATTSAFGMGMDWGGGGGGDPGDGNTCVPDDPLVIIPGPLGSPVRIAPFDGQTFLVADYTRKTLSWYDQSGNLVPFIETLGKPLSVAVDSVFKNNDKLKEAYYYVGNDDTRTIDVYYEKNDQVLLTGQVPVGTNGIQALDMQFDPVQNELFVVDGLSREVKVLSSDGQLVRTIGNGVLVDPKAITVDAAAGQIYVSDFGDPVVYPVIPASVQVFDMTGSLASTISGDGLFSRPQGVALTADKVYLVDSMLAKILEFDRSTGVKTTSFSCQGASEAHLLLPMDVVLDQAGQNFIVADNRNMRITVVPLTQP